MAHLHRVELYVDGGMLRQVADLKDLCDTAKEHPTLEQVLLLALRVGLGDWVIRVKQERGILPRRPRIVYVYEDDKVVVVRDDGDSDKEAVRSAP